MPTGLGTDVSGALIVPMQLPIMVNAALGWRSDEPMEITLRIAPDGTCPECGDALDPIVYRFSRDLMDAAIITPEVYHGEGDIQVNWDPDEQIPGEVLAWPSEPALRVMVKDCADEWQLFVLDARGLIDFMVQSYFLVPKGEETADVDSALLQLLGES